MSEAATTEKIVRKQVEQVIEITDNATGQTGFVVAWSPAHAKKVAQTEELKKLASRFSARKLGSGEVLKLGLDHSALPDLTKVEVETPKAPAAAE